MPHTGDERLLERPIISPFGKGSVDGRVVDDWFALGVLRHGPALPLHPRLEDPSDEVKETMIAQFARRSTLGHREVREETCIARGCSQWHGDRRYVRIFGRGAHDVRTSCEEG